MKKLTDLANLLDANIFESLIQLPLFTQPKQSFDGIINAFESSLPDLKINYGTNFLVDELGFNAIFAAGCFTPKKLGLMNDSRTGKRKDRTKHVIVLGSHFESEGHRLKVLFHEIAHASGIYLNRHSIASKENASSFEEALRLHQLYTSSEEVIAETVAMRCMDYFELNNSDVKRDSINYIQRFSSNGLAPDIDINSEVEKSFKFIVNILEKNNLARVA